MQQRIACRGRDRTLKINDPPRDFIDRRDFFEDIQAINGLLNAFDISGRGIGGG
jgi:hypothetical protein